MRKEEQTDNNRIVKLLSKYYTFLQQYYVRLLLEFCQFDSIVACRVLEVLKNERLPSAFFKKLVEEPNSADKYIQEKLSEFNAKFSKNKIEIIDKLQQSKANQKLSTQAVMKNGESFKFFLELPFDLCINIISYLDPITFSSFVQTNKKLYSLSSSESLHFYFKNLCLKIFKNEPVLPNSCRFTEIKLYAQSHPKQYGPNLTNAINNNLRYLVWKSDPQSFKVESNYYKTFGSYKNIFLYAPRVHFNGIYVCKHKYLRVGEKGFTHNITPLHLIHYYRYMRFFDDGSLLCCTSSRKYKKHQLVNILSIKNLENFDVNNRMELKIGEFMQFKNKLFVKFVRSNIVYSYQMQICSNNKKISDELKVLRYDTEDVDERETYQNIYLYKPHKQKILFSYLRLDKALGQAQQSIKGYNL